METTVEFAKRFAAIAATRTVERAKSISISNSSSNSKHVNNFDGLRLLAALLVVYGHQGQLTGIADGTGSMGLRTLAFFAISGFLVAGSWQADPHASRFLLRRFLRVWPAYAVLIIVCSAFAYAYAAGNLHRLAAMFYLNNLYFRGFDWSFFHGPWPAMNVSIWTMPFEVYCYLLMAFVGVFGRRVLMVVAVATMLWVTLRFGAAAPVVGQIDPFDWDSTWTLYFGGFFSAGIALRLLPKAWLPAALGAGVVVGAACLAIGLRTTGLMLVIPSVLVWVGLRSWPVLRSANRFGDLSLGIFLWAWPIQQVNLLWLGLHRPIGLELAVVLPQVLLIAWLSRHLIELPALRFKPKRAAVEPAGIRLPTPSQFGQLGDFLWGVKTRAF